MNDKTVIELSPEATKRVLKPYFDYVAALEKEVGDLLAHKTAALALRNAAALVVWFDWSDNDSDAVAAIETLRATLTSMPSE